MGSAGIYTLVKGAVVIVLGATQLRRYALAAFGSLVISGILGALPLAG